MEGIIKRGEHVLLLASYCDNCCDALPCKECLEMCNIARLMSDTRIEVVGGYDFLSEGDET